MAHSGSCQLEAAWAGAVGVIFACMRSFSRNWMAALQVLNQLLVHTGLKDEKPFTKDMIKDLHGFQGGYSHEFSADDQEGLRLLREFFRKPQEDLKSLVGLFWPHLNFTVAEES
jgi:hypothetical protein